MHVIGECVTYVRNYLHTKEPKEMELLVNTHSSEYSNLHVFSRLMSCEFAMHASVLTSGH